MPRWPHAPGRPRIKKPPDATWNWHTPPWPTCLSSDETSHAPPPRFFLVSTLEPVDDFLKKARGHAPGLGPAGRDQGQDPREPSRRKSCLRSGKSTYSVYVSSMKNDLTVFRNPPGPWEPVSISPCSTVWPGPNRIHAAQKLEETGRADATKNWSGTWKPWFPPSTRELMKARETIRRFASVYELCRRKTCAPRRRAFEEGLATSLEVVDAQLALSAAEVERFACGLCVSTLRWRSCWKPAAMEKDFSAVPGRCANGSGKNEIQTRFRRACCGSPYTTYSGRRGSPGFLREPPV